MRQAWTIALVTVCLLCLTVAVTPVGYAQETPTEEEPSPPTTQGLTFFTPYPSQQVAPAESATFAFTLRTGGAPQVVQLSMQDLPDGWTATFRGGGKLVQSAYVEPGDGTLVDLRVEPPKDAPADTYQFDVVASSDTDTVRFPVALTIEESSPTGLTMDVELPTLRGAPATPFRYSASLENSGSEDTTVTLSAEAPPGLQVDFTLAGQNVTSVPLAANESKTVSIEVQPFPDLPAGPYEIRVLAQGTDAQATTTLIAEITGQSDLSLSAPDGRLSGQASLGTMTPFTLVLENRGSASARNIELTASPPAGWQVTFEPERIDEIPGNQSMEVTANVTPSDQALAGDYEVTFTARPEDNPSESATFRITVTTSTLWGLVGVVLIAVAVAVVGGAVMRFGRR